MSRRRPSEGAFPGGCPCGWWSIANCRYIRAVRMCRTPIADRPELPSAALDASGAVDGART